MVQEQKERILVVDDESGIRDGCRALLSSEGYIVETAENGIVGLDLYENKKDFSVVLVDLMMPKMNGLELIERIRQRDQDIILIVITAYSTIETAVEATKKGAFDYITKPFTPEELLLPIKNGLEKRKLLDKEKKQRKERGRLLLEVAFERSKARTIISCMSDGVMVVNQEKKIVLVNNAAKRLFSPLGDIAILSPVESLVCPAFVSLVLTLLEEKSASVVSEEIVLGEHTCTVNVSPLHENGGTIIGVVAVLEDISELKKLETAKAQFISMVSHEVTSHLGAIEGYLQLLSSDDTDMPDNLKIMMERMMLRARTLRVMVSDLMNISAIETGCFTIKRVPVALQEVLAESVQAAWEDAQKKGVTLKELHHDTSFPYVLADRDALLTVFRNLLENAVKYTPSNGHITVAAAEEDGSIAVRIADDGIGMAPEDTTRVFDEFFRVRNRHTAAIPGTGLGLSLVKKIVAMHQGTVEVTSTEGKGSVFTVHLPVLY